MLEKPVLGLPLVLWIVIIGTALLVDLPMVAMHAATQREVVNLASQEVQTNLKVQKLLVTPTASPSAAVTPSATPTLVPFRSNFKPATPTLKVK